MFINFIFIVSAVLTLGCALGVLFTKNIMHACISLLGSLIGLAGLYVSLGADFVAVTQVMVYVGGVVILMLFAIMLTGGKDFVSRAQKLLGLVPIMGSKFSYLIGGVVALFLFLINFKIIQNIISSTPKAGDLTYTSTVEELGQLLITDHVLAFELSSILLLGALVGAAIISRPRKEQKS